MKMLDISVIPDDVFLLVLQYLEAKDRIAFAYSCTRFRQICMDGRAFRQADLSRCLLKGQQGAITKEFLRDKQMVQHIRELNLNNLYVMNWQISIDLEEIIISICPQLESLHVLNCRLSVKSLQHILTQAPSLTSLSWSLRDLTLEGIELLKNGICLEKIRYLHVETLDLREQIWVLQYLVLPRCKYLEELEISIQQLKKIYGVESSWNNIAFPQPSSYVTDVLRHLHSLTILAVGDQPHPCSFPDFDLEIQIVTFLFHLLRKKPNETKWKKFWISPQLPVNLLLHKIFLKYLPGVFPLTDDHCDLHSVQALTAHAIWGLEGLKTIFERIPDNTVKNLHLCVNQDHLDLQANSVVEYFNPALRIGGHALRFLSLSFPLDEKINCDFNRLFCACSNIRELDLLGCHFKQDICGPLSELKQLVKIQVPHCAVLPEYRNQQIKENTNLLVHFVKKCPNILEFDVRACVSHVDEFSSYTFDDDLQTFSKLTKLRSLTLYNIHDLEQCTFLKHISDHCKFLTTLRIKVLDFKQQSYIPILMSSKFLKHLAIDLAQAELGSEYFWQLLSHATNLERLCIKSRFIGSLNIAGAVKMLKCLPQLHVLYLQIRSAQNWKAFCGQIIRTLEEEESDCISFFEFFMWEGFTERKCWTHKMLPINVVELFHMTPILAVPTF